MTGERIAYIREAVESDGTPGNYHGGGAGGPRCYNSSKKQWDGMDRHFEN